MSVRTVVGMAILCCVAGMGCSNKDSVPNGILPKDKMEQVMWDMAQADQYAALYLAKDSAIIDRKAETMRLYAEVFRLHQVTPEQFRKSYHYYLDHPELNQLLFDSVITRGVRARSEMYERPGYHPPAVLPRPGGKFVPPTLRGPDVQPGARLPGAVLPGVRPAGAVGQGGRSPGAVAPPGTGGAKPPMQQTGSAEMMRRMHEASIRQREDSISKRMEMKRDTARRRP